MTYTDTLARLAKTSEEGAARLWGLCERGTITPAEFNEVASDYLLAVRDQGANTASVAFRNWLEERTGVEQAAQIPPLPDDLERLRIALRKIVGGDGDIAMRLARLAGNEALDAAAGELARQLQTSARVSGWRRKLEPDACQLCTWWWRNGRIFQADHPMPRHVGCGCHQQPVFRELTDNYQTADQAKKASKRKRR
ncbi:MAG: hypothetical protein ACOX61_08270 [Brooklawnia sp.]